jgi:transketolase
LDKDLPTALEWRSPSDISPARYNKPGFELFNYNIYAICGDGDLMEGVSSEAASLAGHLGLGNLIYLYDDNHITIEGQYQHHLRRRCGQTFRSL